MVEDECQLYNHLRRLEAASINAHDLEDRLDELAQRPFELNLTIGKRRLGQYEIDISRK